MTYVASDVAASTSNLRAILKNLSTEDMRKDSQKLLLSKIPSGIVASQNSPTEATSRGNTGVVVEKSNVKNNVTISSNNASFYDSNFKKKCLDQVIDDYSLFFRVSRYIEDTRSIYLLTMCSMLDAAANESSGSDANADVVDVDPWDLDSLAENDQLFFTETNWPSVEKNVSIYDQYERLLKVLDRPPTFND